jgi:uncharacterized protein involved in exopolysaccharide biosynthesis
MEEHAQGGARGDEIDLGRLLTRLRPHWWKIVLFSLGVGTVTLIAMFLQPNMYQATAVITPAAEEKKPIPALGALASLGIEVGGPAKVEDLETLFKSNDLTVRVFRKHNLWPIVFKGCFDPASGTLRAGWAGRLLGGDKRQKPPTDWDAIRAAKEHLRVLVNKKSGTLSVTFESPSPEGSADIVKNYLEEGKSRLQEEALDRAAKNKKFIEEQIVKTVDALTRERLYALYGQEVEREMMGRNREQFGFRVIDSPRAPDEKSRPARGRFGITGTFIGFIISSLYFLRRSKPDKSG